MPSHTKLDVCVSAGKTSSKWFNSRAFSLDGEHILVPLSMCLSTNSDLSRRLSASSLGRALKGESERGPASGSPTVILPLTWVSRSNIFARRRRRRDRFRTTVVIDQTKLVRVQRIYQVKKAGARTRGLQVSYLDGKFQTNQGLTIVTQSRPIA